MGPGRGKKGAAEGRQARLSEGARRREKDGAEVGKKDGCSRNVLQCACS